jgi:arginase
VSTIVVPFHLDSRIDPFESPLPAGRTIAPELPSGGAWERMAALYEDVARAVSRDAAPVVISGDCTTSIATVAGLAQTGESPGIVWLDAHGDFNTEETTESGYLGGMPLAKICGLGNLEVAERLGLAPVDPKSVLLVGARDLDPEEDELLASEGVRRASVEGLRIGDLPAGPLYLHVDVDVADPADLPGLIFPVPGGPGQSELTAAIGTVASSGRLAAVGVGLTWNVDGRGSDTRTDYVRQILEPLRDWSG